MLDRLRIGRHASAITAGLGLLLPLLSTAAGAGTNGKLSGRVLDRDGQPLAGANIAMPAARLGALAENDGHYVILNIPAGRYEIRTGLLGYRTTLVQDVTISADHTTTLDVTLEEAPLPMEEVVVSAQRPVVDLNLTSTLATVTREQIKTLPVQELQDIVNLQAGVVDGHFRGGRRGEVQYQVDGVTVNNVYDNTSTLRLDRSLLEEVQIISGTFDAEYGQAMSGVVNAVLRRGTEHYRWNVEALGGGFLYSGAPRATDFSLRPSAIQNYQMSLSGPTPHRNTFFLLSGRYYHHDDWVYGTRRFLPTDVSDVENKVFRPTGDGESVALGNTREWSGIGKLTNVSFENVKLNYQAVFNHIDGRRSDASAFGFRFNPEGLPKQSTVSLTHGLDVNHQLGSNAYYSLSLRQNYFDYKDRVYDDLYDPRYDAAGPPVVDPNYELGAVIQGVSLTRFRQKTNALVLKSSFVSQYARDQQFKAGTEFQWPKMRFGAMGYLIQDGSRMRRVESQPPTFPGVLTYQPFLAAAFAQEDVEWDDLRIRAGLRFEYFDARTSLPSDLRNPANALPLPVPQSVPVATTTKQSVSPRIGISYPVSTNAALFFAYGHFRQMPSLGQAFDNADYGVLATLQAATSNFRVMGNPDVKPELTVQYQFGYRQALTDWLGLEANIFYKDVRDLLGVEFINTYNDAEYARLTNVDFGNVVGFTVALDQRQRGLLSTSVDYTWQLAQGNSSDPNETAIRAQAGADPRPRQVPFNWDQRHTLNLTAMLSRPDDFTASAILRVGSGQPYTPTVAIGFAGGLETNSGRKPTSILVDLRSEKQLQRHGFNASLFARVFNLFDARFFNGFVFSSTGSPDYSRDPASNRFQLANPTRFAAPRRIEVGITMRAGAGG